MEKTTENELAISPAFKAAAAIRANKQLDYGGIYEYFPFGPMSYVHELHKKTKRLVHLTLEAIDPENESVEDNLLDLINYASYYYEFLIGEADD